MSGKRLSPRGREDEPAAAAEESAGVPAPQQVTCPGCGATALLSDHTCPECGQLFYERTHGKTPRVPDAAAPHTADPSIQEFATRMERTEKWTRIICTVLGALFGLVAVLSFTGSALGLHGDIWGIALLALLSIVFLLRGLARPGADESFLSSLPGFGRFRMR